jgi:hypothetical protein
MTKAATISDRERERAVRQKDREHIRAFEAGIKDLRRQLSRQKILARKARRETLAKMRRALPAIRRAEAGKRTQLTLDIARERDRFTRWWESVLIERANRRAEIARLRSQLRHLRATRKSRIAEATRRLKLLQVEELARFDSTVGVERRSVESGIATLLEQLRQERADQRQFKGTARAKRRAAVKRTTQKERRQEYTGGVEANLESPEEQAVWRHEKASILRVAKAKGIKAPDAIAELVRERVEADPDRAIEFLANDSERWLMAELNRKAA